jgi:hypothetical protein
MLAKIIVGVAGLLVVAAGGYMYWQDMGSSPCGRCSRSCDAMRIDCPPAPPCSDLMVSCPNQDSEATRVETLEIAPREAPNQ